MKKLPSELANEFGVDRTTIIEHCRHEHIAHDRGPKRSYLVDVSDFKRWLKTQYRFRDRAGRAGRWWNKQEVIELKTGKIPKGRTPLAIRLKRFHSKPT